LREGDADQQRRRRHIEVHDTNPCTLDDLRRVKNRAYETDRTDRLVGAFARTSEDEVDGCE
jgi:hypothetical protein